jgi:3-oxoisoapionate decarboxylase
MTRLGIGTYACAWSIGVPGYPDPPQPMDALGFIRHCADLGVGLVQIADNLPLHTLSAAELDAVQAETERLGLAIEVGTRGIATDHLRRYLQLALHLGSPILRVVVDTAHHHPDPPEVIDTLRGILPEFEAAGVVLAIENHDRFQARALAHIIESLGSDYVGVCLDTVNSFGSLEGPEVVVDVLGPYVVNLHIKDFRIQRADHNMGFVITGTPAGQGMLDVPWLLRQLGARPFNAILELWPAPEADMAATIAKERAWAEASVRYLRTVIEG